MWYPKMESGDIISVRATLTKLDPSEYRQVVYSWPLHDFIVWAEESRVMEEFKELHED